MPADHELLARLIIRSGECVLNDLMVLARHLRWPELDGQLGELAGEAERRLVVVFVHRGAGVQADVEGFVYFPSIVSVALGAHPERR